MENRKYLTMESFWMFITGLAVGMLIILAVILSRTMNVGEDGQTRLLRNTQSLPQSQISGVNPSFTSGSGQVSGVNPSFNTSTVSGVNPSFTNGSGQVSGVNPSF